jgi:hypothetical protein
MNNNNRRKQSMIKETIHQVTTLLQPKNFNHQEEQQVPSVHKRARIIFTNFDIHDPK